MEEVPRLRAVRAGRGLRLLDVAAHTGVSKQRVSAVESTPVTALQVGTLAAYAHALGGRLMVGIELPDSVVVPVWWGEPIDSMGQASE
ncbi:helix-turn-helix transcriptional regulator [Streptomyces sp. NPDC005395]|uniref:helix-turn-helix domain-containing protein n=1 Tax=Streptomyces sp. NPDC005395 TaxID=3157042 RepID=UPI0033B2BDD2